MDLLRRKCFLCRPANFSSVDGTHCWLEGSQRVFQTPIILTTLFSLCRADWRIKRYQKCLKRSYRIFALLRRWNDFLWPLRRNWQGLGKNLVYWYQGHGRLHTANESWSAKQTIWSKHNVYLAHGVHLCGGSIRPGNNLSIDPLCIHAWCVTPMWYGSNRILFVGLLVVVARILYCVRNSMLQWGRDLSLACFLCRGFPFGLEKNISVCVE